jgi:Ser/Thr protein kinase RdoA (MazF antagonist)
MTAEGFYQAPQEQQIAALAELANQALEHWGLQGAQISTLAYRENMTFAVTVNSKERYALRIHQAGYRSDSQVQSELDFIEHLSQSGILTPEVIRSNDNASLVIVSHPKVPEPRQCDLFGWIEGPPIRRIFEPPTLTVEELEAAYREAGRAVASIYNAAASWQVPATFDRPVWDEHGIFGREALLGDFRMVTVATDTQRQLMEDVATRLKKDLRAFGKAPDRYGLSQCDLLPENLLLTDQGLRIIDFDDCGYTWIMFDLATAVLDLCGTDLFDPCLNAFITGFRELRPLADDQLQMLPAFLCAKTLSLLGHTATRTHLDMAEEAQALLLMLLEGLAAEYLGAGAPEGH